MAGLHQGWHVVRDFAGAASRQKDDDGLGGIQADGRRKFLARSFRRDVAHQGMPDKIRRDASRAIPVLFEWKNTQPAHEPPPHQVGAPGPPGPELRAYEINISNALPLERPREPQVKAREVRK